MSTQLESARFFTPENNPYETPKVAQPDSPPVEADASYAPAALWSPFMSGVCVVCSVFGVLGVIGGLWSLVSFCLADGAMSTLATMEETQVGAQMKAVFDAQMAYMPFAMGIEVFRILIGVAMLAGAAFLRSKKTDANKLVSLVFVAAIVLNLLETVYAWLSTSAMVAVMEMPAEAESVMMMTTVVWLAIGFIFMASIYLGLIAYLSSTGVRAMFRTPERSAGSMV